MASYIIADLHLSEHTSKLNQAFVSFVSELKPQDKLYIAGDLFNFFVALDSEDKAQQLVKETLGQAKQNGVESFFIAGNRDFLLSKDDALALNMTLLDEIVCLDFGPKSVLVTHGDIFCTNDAKYMRYRSLVHNKCLQAIFRAFPQSIKLKIARSIRNKSKEMHINQGLSEIYGIVDNSVKERCLHLHGSICNVIHGHIHNFSSHKLDSGHTRFVLGDWGTKMSYACIEQGEIKLVERALE